MSSPDPSQWQQQQQQGAQNPYAPPPSQPYAGWAQGPQADSSSVEYVSFGTRAGARLIDFAMSWILGFVVGGLLGGVLAAMTAQGSMDASWVVKMRAFSLGSLMFSLLGTTLYHAIAEAFGGASIGKLVLGLRVRSVDLSPAKFGGTLTRSVAFLVDAFMFGAVAYSVMSNSPTQQRLGDKWGSTVVVRARTLPPEAQTGSPAIGILLGLVVWAVCLTLGMLLKVM